MHGVSSLAWLPLRLEMNAAVKLFLVGLCYKLMMRIQPRIISQPCQATFVLNCMATVYQKYAAGVAE